MRRIVFSSLLVSFVALVSGYVAATPSPPSRVARIDAALARTANFLAARQSADGAWRSDVYGPFKEGDALTPLVVTSLLEIGGDPAAYERGLDYLVRMVQPDGSIVPPRYGITYSVYTAAGTVLAQSHERDPKFDAARAAWLNYLCERQLTEPLGWQPDDPQFGGWAYGEDVPQKPGPGEVLRPLSEPNLSSTVFALEALRAAGVPADDPRVQKALAFVSRCQNFTPPLGCLSQADDAFDVDAFDDGGFFFIQGDPVRNKAGVIGVDFGGRERYASYGSATADGLRALLLCGVPHDQMRLVAAREWLQDHFTADQHPGQYAHEREAARAAVYFYYCHSLALAFRAAGVVNIAHDGESSRWAEALAEELLRRQRNDGSWQNTAVDVREDDPLVATPLAASALATCRQIIAASGGH
jgi:squalene-hopene/tetraprenyl-beta-curcumene cyclase